MLRRLKNRWKIDSNFQLLVIVFVFSITGSSSLWVRTQLFHLMGIDDNIHISIRVLLSILFVTPIYQILLVIIGSALGQFRFFWAFEKKMIQRFNFSRKTNSIHEQL